MKKVIISSVLLRKSQTPSDRLRQQRIGAKIDISDKIEGTCKVKYAFDHQTTDSKSEVNLKIDGDKIGV